MSKTMAKLFENNTNIWTMPISVAKCEALWDTKKSTYGCCKPIFLAIAQGKRAIFKFGKFGGFQP